MQKTFNFYADPGHGWVKVPLSILQTLGIADKVSTFSYWRKGHAYLEEDCDAGLLLSALRAKGIAPAFREHVAREKQSKIRGYEHYRAAFHKGAV